MKLRSLVYGLLLCTAGVCISLLAFMADGEAATPEKPARQAAASAKSAALATGGAPEVTTATYGDWLLRCQQGADGPPQCEAVQTLAVDGRPIARIAVGRIPVSGALAVAVNLPANVAFTAPVSLGSANGTVPQLSLLWRRCLPAGCFADVTPTPAQFQEWQSQSGAGELGFVDGNGKAVKLPYSFKGLGDAIKGLGGKP